MTEVIESISLIPELLNLSSLLDEKPECFAFGSRDVQTAALNATKFTFDLSLQSEIHSRPHVIELLSTLNPSEAPQTRSQARNAKRKRTPSPPPAKAVFNTTPLTSLFIEEMDEDQIWSQLDLRTKSICDMLDLALEGEAEDEEEEEEGEERLGEEGEERLRLALQALEDGDSDLEMPEEEDGMNLDEEDASLDEEGEGTGVSESESGDEPDFEEGVAGLRDPSSDEGGEDDDEVMSNGPSVLDSVRKKLGLTKNRVGAHPGLDDGFFDLSSFNAETEAAEAKAVSRGGLGEDSEGSDDDMSVDLFTPLGDVENFDEEDLENDPGEAFYRDFFEPPRLSHSKPKIKSSVHPSPKKKGTVRFHEEVRVKKIKAKGRNLPLSTMNLDGDEDDEGGNGEGRLRLEDDGAEDGDGFDDELDDNDLDLDEGEEHVEQGRETIERLKDDLFAEDVTPQDDLSTHEKRVAALREQIAALEAENVGKKEWVLMGEAGSRTRPQNSLLEEDLEFERVMKAVPVVTEESVQALEERIKARILEGRFDDVARIRPMADKPFLPSRFFELKDTKSTQSLAQIYETEYVAAQTGGIAGEDRDGNLKKEHNEIEQLWEAICGKLDALCNAHYMPKQPKATISTLANVSTATLESALPTIKSTTTMLAPEELFAPSSTDLRARSELTPAEKRSLRGKERKSRKNSRDALDKNVDKYAKVRGIGGVKKQKQAALASVVKNGKGVTVVGKKTKDILVKKDGRSRK